ncbi:unnamed protein product, partial [Iphiclides podalirius]
MTLSRLQLVLLFIVLNYHVDSQQEVLIEESLEVESVHAPTGGSVELPCDIHPAIAEDRVGLVIWYKQGHETPIYSLDIREGVTSHWSDASTLGTRATFRTNAAPAVLVLTRLRPEDSGQYRCRVDFIKSPTKNTRLNLTVLIPPERLLILNQDGQEIEGAVLGPYDEDTPVNMTCIAIGGRPTPRVSWWKSHSLLDNAEGKATASFHLRRTDYGTEITCQAVTDPSIKPLTRTLSVDMNLRPLWVRIDGGPRPLVAGRVASLSCLAVGARPSPTLSWWKGQVKLNTVAHSTSLDGNVTSSVLTFSPKIEDSGRVLSCRAVQPTLVHSTREDGWTMEIEYLPIVKLSFGANIDPDKVVEGSDVYMECEVRANPPHTGVVFTHNDAPVRGGAGVVVANQSLVLQKVSRRTGGTYSCGARSRLGQTTSAPLTLDVKYVPTCKYEETTFVRAARGEIVEIRCELDANPKKPMAYRWWFNSSTHNRRELKSSAHHTAYDELGTIQYVINSSDDYGWVQCLGFNPVGGQIQPCLFQILPAEKPSSPKSCEVTNVTFDSLAVSCVPGYDGGLQQTFQLEVYEAESGALLRNLSGHSARFAASALTARALVLRVRAANAKGASDALLLNCRLPAHPERRTAAGPVRVELTTLLVTVLVALGLLAVTVAVSATMCYCKYCSNGRENNEKTKKPQDDTSDVLLASLKKTDSSDSVDKNPDIIPIKSKLGDCPTNTAGKLGPTFDGHGAASDGQYERRYTPVRFQRLPQTANVGANAAWQPCDAVYEDWLRYKNALPLDTSDLLPLEQLRPADAFASRRVNTLRYYAPAFPDERVSVRNNGVFYNKPLSDHGTPTRSKFSPTSPLCERYRNRSEQIHRAISGEPDTVVNK